MKRTSFVCFGAKGNKDALVYQEIPGREGGEEFFLFFSPGEPEQEPVLRALFREAVSASRLGAPSHYFNRFLDQMRAVAAGANDGGEGDPLDGMLLLIEIRRGSEVHLLCNRDAQLIHCDGKTGRRDSGESLKAFSEIPLARGRDQQDLFRRAPEDAFSLYRFMLGEGEHTIVLAPSSEFVARHEESLRNSVFFPSFTFPLDAGIELAVSRSFPALHWKDGAAEETVEAERGFRSGGSRARAPIIGWALAGAAAIVLLFGFLATREKAGAPEGPAVLLGAEDAGGESPARNAAGGSSDPDRKGPDEARKREAPAISEAWKRSFQAPVTSSARFCRGKVYFGCRDGNLYAFTPEGERIWHYRSGSGIGASPCCVDNRIIGANYGGNVFCLDAGSGKAQWSVATRSKIVSTPGRIGDAVVAATSDGRVVAMRLADGRKLWEKKLGASIRANLATGKDFVIAVTTDGALVRLDRRGAIVWKAAIGAGVASSPACDEERGVVVCGGKDRAVHAFSLSTGGRLWRYPTDGAADGAAAIAAGAVYIGAQSGTLYSLTTDGTLRWKRDVGGAVNSRPLIAGSAVFVTTYAAELVAVDAGSGEPVGAYRAGSAIYSSPEADGTRIYFGSNGGVFHAVRVEPPAAS